MNKITLLDEEARIEAEEKFVEDRTIDMESLKTDFKFMHDILEKGKKLGIEETEEKPIILTDEKIERGFRKMPKDKREDLLKMSVKAKDIEIRQKIEARENRKSDIAPVANLSKKSWSKLPKVGREAVLQKVCSLQQELIRK